MKIHTGSESHVQEKVYNRMTEIGRQSVRKEGEIIPEQSTYSFADFLRKVVSAFARKGSKVECVQTANGFEFANRFSPSKREIKTFFEQTAFDLGIRPKRLHPYTPRHNGKAEHSHREDQKRYDSNRFLLSHQLWWETLAPCAFASGAFLFSLCPCPICLANLHFSFLIFPPVLETRKPLPLIPFQNVRCIPEAEPL